MAIEILRNQPPQALQTIDYISSQQPDVQLRALEIAVENNDEDAAAQAVRTIRNRLLSETDAQVALDRIDVDTDSATKFINSIKNVLNGEWAVYRQQLRDIPQQEGFPFNVVFPVSPDDIVEEGTADGI